MTMQKALYRAHLITAKKADIAEHLISRVRIIDSQLNLLYNNPLKYEHRINNLESQRTILISA